MPQFYFHLETPAEMVLDDMGIDLPTAERAYLEACNAIPGTAAELMTEGHDPARCAFHVADGAGLVHWVVPMLEHVPYHAELERASAQSLPPRGDLLLQRLDDATAELRQELDEMRQHRAVTRAEVDRLKQLRTDLEGLFRRS